MLTLPARISYTLAQLEEAVPRLHRAYYRPALVVGKKGARKTRLLRALHQKGGYLLLNVNPEVYERLLEHTIAERSRLTARFLGEIVKEAQSPIVLRCSTIWNCSSTRLSRSTPCNSCNRSAGM